MSTIIAGEPGPMCKDSSRAMTPDDTSWKAGQTLLVQINRGNPTCRYQRGCAVRQSSQCLLDVVDSKRQCPCASEIGGAYRGSSGFQKRSSCPTRRIGILRPVWRSDCEGCSGPPTLVRVSALAVADIRAKPKTPRRQFTVLRAADCAPGPGRKCPKNLAGPLHPAPMSALSPRWHMKSAHALRFSRRLFLYERFPTKLTSGARRCQKLLHTLCRMSGME